MTRPSDGDRSDRIGRLYDELGPSLYRYALMILADHGLAADVVQQVFVGMLRAARSVYSDERYLRRAVRNECYSTLRRRRRTPETPADPLLEPISPDDGAGPDERMAIEQAMRALTPEQRDVVHLKVFEGWTFQEIADFCGESKNTIASRYRYALEKMSAAAAAALFALMAQRAQTDIASRMNAADARRAEAVSRLTTALGDDELARAEAERIMSDADGSEIDPAAAPNPRMEQSGQ